MYRSISNSHIANIYKTLAFCILSSYSLKNIELKDIKSMYRWALIIHNCNKIKQSGHAANDAEVL